MDLLPLAAARQQLERAELIAYRKPLYQVLALPELCPEPALSAGSRTGQARSVQGPDRDAVGAPPLHRPTGPPATPSRGEACCVAGCGLALTRAASITGGAPKKQFLMCSLQQLTCSQVQVLPRQWMVGPSSDSRPRRGETLAGASSAVNGRACRRPQAAGGDWSAALAACRTWKPISVAGPCHQIPLLTKIKIF